MEQTTLYTYRHKLINRIWKDRYIPSRCSKYEFIVWHISERIANIALEKLPLHRLLKLAVTHRLHWAVGLKLVSESVSVYVESAVVRKHIYQICLTVIFIWHTNISTFSVNPLTWKVSDKFSCLTSPKYINISNIFNAS